MEVTTDTRLAQWCTARRQNPPLIGRCPETWLLVRYQTCRCVHIDLPAWRWKDESALPSRLQCASGLSFLLHGVSSRNGKNRTL